MTIRWGILGCGDVTELKSGPGFQKARDSSLVAVMRRTGVKAQDYARRHGVARWYDRAEDLIRDPEVDAVYVATPPGAHHELALAVAAAGKPAYIEKPMARCAVECHEISAAFARAGKPVFVAFYRRSLPRFERVREWLEEGRVGLLQSVSYELNNWPWPDGLPSVTPWRLMPETSGGGLFMDLGSHALDLLDHWVGPFRSVCGRAWREAEAGPALENRVELEWTWEGGVRGHAQFDFRPGQPPVDRFVLEGEEGKLSVPCFAEGPVRWEPRNGEPREEVIPHPQHVHQPLIQTVVDCLGGRGGCPSTGESATRTAAVMDTVLEGYYKGREPGFWQPAR